MFGMDVADNFAGKVALHSIPTLENYYLRIFYLLLYELL